MEVLLCHVLFEVWVFGCRSIRYWVFKDITATTLLSRNMWGRDAFFSSLWVSFFLSFSKDQTHAGFGRMETSYIRQDPSCWVWQLLTIWFWYAHLFPAVNVKHSWTWRELCHDCCLGLSALSASSSVNLWLTLISWTQIYSILNVNITECLEGIRLLTNPFVTTH